MPNKQKVSRGNPKVHAEHNYSGKRTRKTSQENPEKQASPDPSGVFLKQPVGEEYKL